jgi:hypothetical protein
VQRRPKEGYKRKPAAALRFLAGVLLMPSAVGLARKVTTRAPRSSLDPLFSRQSTSQRPLRSDTVSFFCARSLAV